ncbi:hypothetical protein [Arthrobacter sp. NPDC093139]|uniref:hypothetical protein n=1 Tax=Arthrobacter sp. NPDC093139 TaxID=3363945 RepID=UPI0037F66F15
MENTQHEQLGRNTVTLVRWSKRPGEDPLIRFVLLSVLGLVLCLISMLFLPILRNFSAIALFMVIFPAILTVPSVSSRRSFMRDLTKTVNDTISEVTGARSDRVSVRQFQQLVKSGEQLPLLVNGVPGLNLRVERGSALEKNAPEKWRVVFTVIPPDNGTASFDRLLAAAIDTGPEAPTAS